MIDNGMPCVILRAADIGVAGTETPAELEADQALRARLEAIRLQAGPRMNLGDVAKKSVPKMTMVERPDARAAPSRPAPSSPIAATRASACWARSASPPPA